MTQGQIFKRDETLGTELDSSCDLGSEEFHVFACNDTEEVRLVCVDVHKQHAYIKQHASDKSELHLSLGTGHPATGPTQERLSQAAKRGEPTYFAGPSSLYEYIYVRGDGSQHLPSGSGVRRF